jgi:hydrogenase maturation factor HypF (carbamoyltransferase family)
MKREIVTLHGRVQGVGFRERVVQIARAHAVAGTVRNLRAGYLLEIDVEGDNGEVDAFVEGVLERRPFLARIDGVHRRPEEPRGVVGFELLATE